MKYGFQYLGERNGRHYFTIITNDERGLNQLGIDICYHYYVMDSEGKITQVGYFELEKLNTWIHKVNGDIIGSVCSQVSPYQALMFYKNLVDSKAEVDLGYRDMPNIQKVWDLCPVEIVSEKINPRMYVKEK